jgi:hypothetical protein
MNTVFRTLVLLIVATLFGSAVLSAQRAIFVEETYADADFDLSNSDLPSWDIIPGGPGKDGIPALTNPAFTTAKKDNWLADEDLVIGISINGIAKAYPVRVLNYHEIVNDEFKGEAVAVTYSPLCGSAMAYRTNGKDYQNWELAVSGLLYNNNALYFDRQTESLWSQVLGRAVAGPVAGAQMELLPTTLTTWKEWRQRNPETLVLSKATGHRRNYDLDAYAYYATTDRLMFPLNHNDDRLAVKERVIGIEVDGEFKAYPYTLLRKAENFLTADVINGQEIQIEFVPEAQAAYVTDGAGNPFHSASIYWFSWSATHPATMLYSLPGEGIPTGLSMSLGAL